MNNLPRVNTASAYNGIGRVLTNDNDPNNFRVVMTIKKGDEEIEKKFTVSKGSCPKWLKRGVWRLRVSTDGKKVESAVPVTGQFVARWKGIMHKDGAVPSPVKRHNTYGDQEYDTLNFTLVWEVFDGQFKGMELVQFHRYDFFVPVGSDDGDVVGVKVNANKPSKYALALEQAMVAAGIFDRSMAWKDNLLPVIDKRGKKAAAEGRTVVLTVNDGYIVGVSENFADEDETGAADAWEDEEDAAVEEKEAPKATKKASKKAAPVANEDEAPKAKAPAKKPKAEPDPDEDTDDDEIPWSDGDDDETDEE